MLAFSPFCAWTSNLYSKNKRKQLKAGDERISLVTETVEAIRVVKLYGYEACFQEKALIYRNQEIQKLKNNVFLRALLAVAFEFGLVGATFLTFVAYSLTGHDLEPATVFAALQLFNILDGPMAQLPMSIMQIIDALVASRRLCSILIAEDAADATIIDTQAVSAIHIQGKFTFELSTPPDLQNSSLARNIENKESKTLDEMGITEGHDEKQHQPFCLNGIQLKVDQGDLVCIIGSVGSGKSALMQALIGEMRPLQGKVILNSKPSYVPQQPWIQNCTLKEQILFGSKEDTLRFNQAIKACALDVDILALANGVDTEIGGGFKSECNGNLFQTHSHQLKCQNVAST
jgi:ATP-binding cassette, subfamily C (CFTR/MRP), member 1